MAKLETLRPSIYGKTTEELHVFFAELRERRLEQLTIVVDKPAKVAKSKKAAGEIRVMLSPAEKLLAKELGISLQTLLKMRSK